MKHIGFVYPHLGSTMSMIVPSLEILCMAAGLLAPSRLRPGQGIRQLISPLDAQACRRTYVIDFSIAIAGWSWSGG